MKYIFQRSKIWIAGPEHRARRQLPSPGMGRIWVLVGVKQ